MCLIHQLSSRASLYIYVRFLSIVCDITTPKICRENWRANTSRDGRDENLWFAREVRCNSVCCCTRISSYLSSVLWFLIYIFTRRERERDSTFIRADLPLRECNHFTSYLLFNCTFSYITAVLQILCDLCFLFAQINNKPVVVTHYIYVAAYWINNRNLPETERQRKITVRQCILYMGMIEILCCIEACTE